ncbi:hypothetical protein PPL_03749 [Heterostelium album PN500]|uniref:Uncharacterized protein n=1 Tax=Heterostelium pallidum (strain ATCC 26659 / Pp 5 / PN500) TaxID=670386 RepID=D3B6K1_HETP5|nr:hypothetical protein PPL_03749 [Heterostelium album PN500]EFA82971.1 hypothetical protein PPL_03749 [Heterostelium album PN500]|eukprot:XP_020435088.1 hypothetical protein PPL_03749 [Heterostelium album PN500]
MDPIENFNNNSTKKIGLQDYSDLYYNVSLNGKNEGELDYYTINNKSDVFENELDKNNTLFIHQNNINGEFLNNNNTNSLVSIIDSFEIQTNNATSKIENLALNSPDPTKVGNKVEENKEGTKLNKRIKKLKREIKLRQKLLDKAVSKKKDVKVISNNEDNIGNGLLPLPSKNILSYSMPMVFPSSEPKVISEQYVSLNQSAPVVFSPTGLSNQHTVLPLSPLITIQSMSNVQNFSPKTKQGLLPNPYINRVQPIYPYYSPYQNHRSVNTFSQQHHYHHNYQMQKIQQQQQLTQHIASQRIDYQKK